MAGRSLVAALTAALFSCSPLTVLADGLAKRTIALPEDKLAVTVSAASKDISDPLESDLSIWVGEVELEGRKLVWVELLDSYGEVIYESEIGRNITYLLPDGRAIVVRDLAPGTRVLKADISRVPMEGQEVTTRRVVDRVENGIEQHRSVEYVEERPERDARAPSTMTTLARVGEEIWAAVSAFFSGAADRAQIAWAWLVDTIKA